ncbi:GerMN domain-containing protein [bacterium]|nr:GerMN domain-containing protein [bacterium]
MNRPIVIGIVLFLVIFGGLFYFVKHRPAHPTQNRTQSSPQTTTSKPEENQANQRRINVKLYFASNNSTLLQAEDRFVPYHDNLHDQAFEVLKELVKGPSGELIPTIPEGTLARDLFITKDGVAYADFSAALSANHTGGSLSEMNTVFSIVDTLTLNFPEIKRVQILIEDQAVDTLNGHLDLSRPLQQDLSFVAAAQRAKPEIPQTEPGRTN